MTKSTTDIPILDDDAVREIEARYAKATEPPWDALSIEQSLEADKWMRGDNNKNDSIFMAHARADIPALCQTVRALRAENERLKLRITQVERDAKDDADAASNEARWQERQGEDYGSY